MFFVLVLEATKSTLVYSASLSLPQPTLPNGTDSIRTPSGIECRSAIGADQYMEMGAFGTSPDSSMPTQGGVYVRFIMPLGKKPKRLDCDRLYQLEVKRYKQEIDAFSQGIHRMNDILDAPLDDEVPIPTPGGH